MYETTTPMSHATAEYLKKCEKRLADAAELLAEIDSIACEAEAWTPDAEEDGREAFWNLKAAATSARQAVNRGRSSAQHAFRLAWEYGGEEAA